VVVMTFLTICDGENLLSVVCRSVSHLQACAGICPECGFRR
jgi:hypothetical protein